MYFAPSKLPTNKILVHHHFLSTYLLPTIKIMAEQCTGAVHLENYQHSLGWINEVLHILWNAFIPLIISDTSIDGNFQWVQGSTMSYTNWNDGMPKDTVGQDDCGSIYTGINRAALS